MGPASPLGMQASPWPISAGCRRQARSEWSPADRSFERSEENAGGVPEEEFPLPDVAGEHGVRGVASLLSDLERARRPPGVALVAKPAVEL